ncbi:MAG TPA: hypothetical protein VFQ68_04235 [Streptosporangiaceae bacterium]|nr:hypothetical protein [Streptosporangiaceae bacterium]
MDELDLAAQPRTVSEGRADGVHWSIRAECDRVGVLCTVVTYTCEGASAIFSVLGASLHNGQLLSLWVGRERDARPFLLLRTAPAVMRATAVLASGDRHEVTLSPVIEDFRLRFGGVPLREDDPLVSVELAGPEDVAQIVELWRPPRLALPGQATPAAELVPPAPRPVPPAAELVPPARNG